INARRSMSASCPRKRDATDLRDLSAGDLAGCQNQLAATFLKSDGADAERPEVFDVRLGANDAILGGSNSRRIVRVGDFVAYRALEETQLDGGADVGLRASVIEVDVVVAAFGHLDVPRHAIFRASPVGEEGAIRRASAAFDASRRDAIAGRQQSGLRMADRERTIVRPNQREHLQRPFLDGPSQVAGNVGFVLRAIAVLTGVRLQLE